VTSGSAHNLALESRETLRELDARVVAVLDELNSARSWCTHSRFRGAGRGCLAPLTGPEACRHIEVANRSITTLRVVDGVRRLVRANEVGHLERRR
jgi:broad specificity phosphatase PhoE